MNVIRVVNDLPGGLLTPSARAALAASPVVGVASARQVGKGTPAQHLDGPIACAPSRGGG